MNNHQKLIVLVIFILLSIPLSAYIYQFGVGFWGTPNEWADLGSYIGGIYTPILSILTLLVLLTQIFLQYQQHQQNQAQHQEQLMTEYIHELNQALSEPYDEEWRVRDFLLFMFRDLTAEKIEAMEFKPVMDFNKNHHKVYSMWCGLSGLLNNLANNPAANHAIAKNRVVAHLDPQMCRLLDKYHYSISVAGVALGIQINLGSLSYNYWDKLAGA